MRLKEVVIKNFRGYREETRVPIDPNITCITGKNDAGKSSILEALDIFFDGGEVTIERDDFNVAEPDGVVEIRCIFELVIPKVADEESLTDVLTIEHLLNDSGELEILKRYKRGAKEPSVSFICNHPGAEGFKDLHLLSIEELKKRAKLFRVEKSEISDARRSAAWRSAIWSKSDDLDKQKTELSSDQFSADSKTITTKVLSRLPLFALFKSDNENRDNAAHAKEPLQAAVKQAQEELRAEIEKLKDEIQARVLERAEKTIEKLREMDESLASKLVPRFKKNPTWSFDFTLEDEHGIPINKRGSGFRRLILLNFFRAEAERKVSKENARAVIYAIEEPETSQHPSNQELLIESLNRIGAKDGAQVIITTHVPALASMVPVDGLRLVEETDGRKSVRHGNDDVLAAIAQSLGVLVDPLATDARGLILVEGVSDVVFLRHAAEVLKRAGQIHATLDEKRIFILSIGGCDNLKKWKAERLADQFGIPWGILLDSDVGTDEESKNRTKIEQLRRNGKKAYLTRKREAENYILPEVVEPFIKDGSSFEFGDTDDAKKLINRVTGTPINKVLETFWSEMNAEQIRQSERYIDENGNERFELTEMLEDFLQMV